MSNTQNEIWYRVYSRKALDGSVKKAKERIRVHSITAVQQSTYGVRHSIVYSPWDGGFVCVGDLNDTTSTRSEFFVVEIE